MLNGADGLSEIAAGLVSQGLTILESVKKSLASSTNESVEQYELAESPENSKPAAQ